VIPALLLSDGGLVKTRQFNDPVYVGDPINATRIFNEKEVDELVVLDIDAAVHGASPRFELIAEIAGEAFMPLAYGGGVRSVDDAKRLIRSGIEKVVVNSAAYDRSSVIEDSVQLFGSQAIVGAVDVKRSFLGRYNLVCRSGKKAMSVSLEAHLESLVKRGVGEIIVTSVDREGTMDGFDLELVRRVASYVPVPVVAHGGAGSVAHLAEAVRDGGASAVCAGSMFVFHGKRRAVLISYPSRSELAVLE